MKMKAMVAVYRKWFVTSADCWSIGRTRKLLLSLLYSNILSSKCTKVLLCSPVTQFFTEQPVNFTEKSMSLSSLFPVLLFKPTNSYGPKFSM